MVWKMGVRVNLVIIFSLVLISCSGVVESAKTTNKETMKLMVLSNYGAEETVISDSTSADQIKKTIEGLDWSDFHQVVLIRDNSNWIEVGGDLSDSGLSAIYEENGEQFVTRVPPNSVDQMTKILVSYFNGDGKYLKQYKFDER